MSGGALEYVDKKSTEPLSIKCALLMLIPADRAQKLQLPSQLAIVEAEPVRKRGPHGERRPLEAQLDPLSETILRLGHPIREWSVPQFDEALWEA